MFLLCLVKPVIPNPKLTDHEFGGMAQHNTTTTTANDSNDDNKLRRQVAALSVEGLPPSAGVRRWRETSILLAVAFLGVASGAIGFGLSGPYGAAVASVFVLGCVLAASPVLAAAFARRRDELDAVHST